MKLNLYYEHFTNKDVKCKDYFDLIIKRIDSTFIFQKYVSNEYLIVDPEMWQDYSALGYTFFDRDGKEYVNINTLKISFFEIPDDYKTIRDDLIKLFGKDAVRYEIVEEGEIVDGSIQ